MQTGYISFCDKTAFNIKSDRVKKKILQNINDISNIKIIQKHFDVLNENHFKLKNEIEINQRNYEKIIQEATDEISSFVEKANLNNLS